MRISESILDKIIILSIFNFQFSILKYVNI